MQDAQSGTVHLIEDPRGKGNFHAAVPTQQTVVFPAVSIQQTCAAAKKPKSTYTLTGLQLGSGMILDAYVRVFDRLFVPYNGADEPPTFEPEDYPVR